jgi:RimJ/RimL family protein N-acetyltransferase
MTVIEESDVGAGSATVLRIPTLHTERLVLRALRAEDLDPFAAIVSDPEVMRFLDDGEPLTRQTCWRGMALFLGHWHLRGYGWWGVEERATGRFLGRVGLYNPEGWPGIELGWLLARSSWGKGYATEAGRAALEWGFTVVGADEIISIIRPQNSRSIRVAEKLGERLVSPIELAGRDALLYAIRRDSR